MHHHSIIGLPVAATNYADAISWILERAQRRDRAYAVEAANTHVAALARTDPAFGEAMRRFDLITPDGMPLVWTLNAQLPSDQRLTDRVYGPTLMLETIRATDLPDTPHRHFLLGGKASTLESLTRRFTEEFPHLRIADSFSPRFGAWTDAEIDEMIERIRDSGADLIWVGFGCPKQEHWIAKYKDRLPPGVYFGIGAAFAFHAGEVKQSPPVLQKLGLEWAYRLAMEPRRLFKRYFTYNSLFVYHLLRDHMKD